MKVLKVTRSGTHPYRWRVDIACGHGGAFVTSMKEPEITEIECPAGCTKEPDLPNDVYERLWNHLSNAGNALEAAQDEAAKFARSSGCYHSGGGISFLCGHCEKAYHAMERTLRALGCKAVNGVWMREGVAPACSHCKRLTAYCFRSKPCCSACSGEHRAWVPVVEHSDSAEIIRAQRGSLED